MDTRIEKAVLSLVAEGHVKEAAKLAAIYSDGDEQDTGSALERVKAILDAKNLRYKLDHAEDGTLNITLFGDHTKNELDRMCQAFRHVNYECSNREKLEGLYHITLTHAPAGEVSEVLEL